MLLNLYARSAILMAILWGMVFALAMAAAYFITMAIGPSIPAGYQFLVILIPVIFSILFVFLQYLISPYIMDWTLRWIFDLDIYAVEELPPHISDFLNQHMRDWKFSLKWVAIINDNNPNAFTYGHTRKNARIVISRGILEYLTPEEQIAVIAHECGHIVHSDFIWMTIAIAIPLLCYSFYRGLIEFSRAALSDDDGVVLGIPMLIVALVSWLFYYFSHFLVLFLSRTREFYADQHAGEVTGQPGDLSRALVKIAYGMIKAEANYKTTISNRDAPVEDRRIAARRYGYSTGIRALGIFDMSAARSLGMSAYGRGTTELNQEDVAAAASWDLNHPWGAFLEIQSTHPLPAKRILALNGMQEHYGQEPEFPLVGKIKPPESLWDEFLIDLFLIYIAPWMFFVLPLIGAALAVVYAINILIGVGLGLILFGLIWKLRRKEKYPHLRLSEEKVTVLHCLTDMTPNGYYEASPFRGKRAVLKGTVVGRGTPGYFLSEDLVIKDETGILTLDYNPVIGIASWWFALFKVNRLMGQQVRVYGWYHRMPKPVLQVWRIIDDQANIYKNRRSGLNCFINWTVFLIGIILVGIGYALELGLM